MPHDVYTDCREFCSCDFWAFKKPASLRLGNGRLSVCWPGKVRRYLVLKKGAGGRVSVACKDLGRITWRPEASAQRGMDWSGESLLRS